MKTYCTDCGFKVEYPAGQTPNFCPKCGCSFNSANSAKIQQTEQIQEDQEEAELNLDLDDDFELEVEIMERPKASNKLSDIMGTSSGSPQSENQPKRGRGRPKKVKNEDVWKQFQNEAGGQPHRGQTEN
jgi:predicted  nucleic acid-binding Zn-ribbon protein